MMQPGFDIDKLRQEAQSRWLKPSEVFFILQNHEKYPLTPEPPKKPPSGSLFLFNRRILRFFRKDGHMWRKKKDGRTVGEAHERLKVENVEALNCYYAHGAQNPYFQRRSYWMLDPAYEHIVLVHYREVAEGRYITGSVLKLPADSSTNINQSTSFDNAEKHAFTPGVSDLCEPYQSSCSPGSVEVSSRFDVANDGMDRSHAYDRSGHSSGSSQTEVSHALRKLAEQLSLDDDDDDVDSIFVEEKLPPYSSHDKSLDSGCNLKQQFLLLNSDCKTSWNQVLGLNSSSTAIDTNGRTSKNLTQGGDHITSKGDQAKDYTTGSDNVSVRPYEPPEKLSWQQLDYGGNNARNRASDHQMSGCNLRSLSEAREFLLGPDNSIESPASALLQEDVLSGTIASEANSGLGMFKKENGIDWLATMQLPVNNNAYSPDYSGMWFDESQFLTSLGANSSLTVAQKQLFSIREISPECALSPETTKVIITGDFLCNPSECTWAVMFGDTEVPVEIIQEGVLRCQTPQHVAGKVTLCVTSGNREACSEIREFEYLAKPKTSSFWSNLTQAGAMKSTEELLLLSRFVQFLLCGYDGASVLKEDIFESENDPLRKLKSHHQLEQIIESLTVGCENPSGTIELLLLELLKDKMEQWLLSKLQESKIQDCSLSKREQGIIHMVSGLGYEWALHPILNSGIGVNFRDPNGWTALHWAARFGRENVVAALLAAGASAGAVTDPTSQDPVGKTPASIAAASGNKGLAGYLSEAALTDHLSSLRIEESEISIGSATVEAERAVESISERSIQIQAGATEDQLSLKDSLAAVRNAAQAAARIQSAFRAHSFRKRQQKDAASRDENDMTPEDIQGLHTAALYIQRKYRGWKGRKKFLTLRQHVVKIQAHVRGHQVRKAYKVFIWTVGVVEKIILRWRRKGVGLRGFRAEPESIDDTIEDVLKVFRKQKVDVALDEAVSRVLSMVESPEARKQYRRMLESYRLAKAEVDNASEEATSSFQGKYENMDDDMDPLSLEEIWAHVESPPTIGFKRF